jgi:acetoin utilization deacetylase AcuC-like enzyme
MTLHACAGAGDGTAAIFAEDASVFTFSMHCAAQSFPSPLQRSDLDIALPAGTGDEEYMKVLPYTMCQLISRP